MISVSQIIQRFRNRSWLIAVLAVLLVLNLGRLAVGHYTAQREETANRSALLERYRESTRDLEAVRKKVARLERRKTQLDANLLSGDSEEEITSSVQILLQELVAKAGLETESLRPVNRGNKSKERDFGEITVKARLDGTMNQFMEFLAVLYKAKQVFKIENFTLRPNKKTRLKIFIELKGYYKLKA